MAKAIAYRDDKVNKNIAIACLVFLLIGSNLWQFLEIVKRGFTISAMNGERYELERSQEHLEKIASHFTQDVPVSEMENLLEDWFPDALIYTEADYLHSDFLSFKINSEKQSIESVEHNPDK